MRRWFALFYGLTSVATQLYIIFVEHRGEYIFLNWLALIPMATVLGLLWPLLWLDRWLHLGGTLSLLLAAR